MDYKLTSLFLITLTVFILQGCGSTSSTPDTDTNNILNIIDQTQSYRDINASTGFSTQYLANKKFHRPVDYSGNYYIQTHEFTNSEVSWSDNFFNSNGKATYKIVSVNGINGVIEYNDGVYNLYYNIYSVETDHLKVCYTYTGLGSVNLCDESQTLTWSFDNIPFDSNLLGSWSRTIPGTQCEFTLTFETQNKLSSTSSNEIVSGSYQFIHLSGTNTRYYLLMNVETDNLQTNCSGRASDDTGSYYFFAEIFNNQLLSYLDPVTSSLENTYTKN